MKTIIHKGKRYRMAEHCNDIAKEDDGWTMDDYSVKSRW